MMKYAYVILGTAFGALMVGTGVALWFHSPAAVLLGFGTVMAFLVMMIEA